MTRRRSPTRGAAPRAFRGSPGTRVRTSRSTWRSPYLDAEEAPQAAPLEELADGGQVELFGVPLAACRLDQELPDLALEAEVFDDPGQAIKARPDRVGLGLARRHSRHLAAEIVQEFAQLGAALGG